ncbi:MAG: hypothetical protein ACRC7O_11270, partial [Fimbriiglobus sp.]
MLVWIPIVLFLMVMAGGAVVAGLLRLLGGDGHVRYAGQPSSGTGTRVFWVLVGVGGAALAVSLFAPARVHVSAPPPPDPMSRMSARTLQTHAASNGVVGAAAAGQRAIAVANSDRPVPVAARGEARPYPPPGGPLPAVHLSRVRSEAPAASRDRAVADALGVAREKLAVALAGLDPQIFDVPSAEEIRRKYLRAESVTEIPPTQPDRDAW